jgi:hypothetical protein
MVPNLTVHFTVGPRLSLPRVIRYIMYLAHLCCDDSHPPLLLSHICLLVTTPLTFLKLAVELIG